jgi:tetratricopeptide (TPR) repeat protein
LLSLNMRAKERLRGKPATISDSFQPWDTMAGMTRRAWFAFFLLSIFCPVAAAAQTGNQNAASAIAAALHARNYSAALDLLAPALRQTPDDARLWTFQGLAYSGEEQKTAALQSFKKALEVSPEYLPALEGAAQLEYETGDSGAEALLERVVKLVPGNSTAHVMLASLAFRNHNCVEAVAQFEQSSPEFQSKPFALRSYGICLAKLERYEQARKIFEQLLAQPGDDARDLERLAAVQLALNQAADAVSTLEPALAGHPSAVVLAEAAEAYEEQKNTPQAVSLLHRAIVENPGDTDLYLQFADVALIHQSFQVGVDMLTAGLKQAPGSAALYVARGVLYVQMADYDQAESDFEQADKLDPQLTISEAASGMLAEQQNDLDKALAVVRDKLRKNPHDAMLLFVEADILAQRNPEVGTADFEQATAAAQQASELQPKSTDALDLLGKLDLEADNNQRAIDESREALRRNPDDQPALYHLIVALRRTGQKDELPALLQRLAVLRQKATREEAEHNRYKLIEESDDDTAAGK